MFLKKLEIMNEKKEFTAENVGTGPISINSREYGLVAGVMNIMPVKLFLKEDGAKDNGPVIALFNLAPGGLGLVCQISLKMLNEGLADIGYELIKK
jgi:hypothetical protein